MRAALLMPDLLDDPDDLGDDEDDAGGRRPGNEKAVPDAPDPALDETDVSSRAPDQSESRVACDATFCHLPDRFTHTSMYLKRPPTSWPA